MSAHKKRHPAAGKKFHLADLDVAAHLRRGPYLRELEELQQLLRQIQQAYLCTGDRGIVVFEGWDAAGKGGTIRRMSAVMDPRGFKVWPIAAPTDVDKVRHYLYRFWERVPPVGAISVFDRSWYGRVLVERVEGFAEKAEWSRAYGEINEFEKMLRDDGARIVKIFLHITADEQLHRFEERLNDPMKRWKLTYEDFRNREKWNDYEKAINEMVRRTSTDTAPWHVISANDKKHARIEALRIITDTLAEGVDLNPRPMDAEAKALARAVFGSLPKDLD
ncbi:polyphosphate kinase [Pelagibius litoralis]|uniref:Polyphosphate kinase n=1 Tax=Pelagibius litoralis TaxID=374515 RepID=A0A967CA72_9PROT|nr:polyphosphate kinase [Pelagibius litoralis]NIA67169.1 polyphosphate kinase [Pelagibius litoralis]